MKTPGPDHPITIEANPRRIRVSLGGLSLADSRRTLTLREANYPPVHYIPREDAAMTQFEPGAHVTHCPYKGDASYFSVKAGSHAIADAIWSYERPYPAVAAIAGHLAFYPDRVKIEETAD
ncbi:DUF427 domain-containing protein [Bradyrhizobium sp. WD16]|uniref:DUF427 domain-containing protein n=1 Tax=Bradyrhizobium sp. WD16 TaxID=1521768 RepID=UPI0020A52016|nr:DUF427 domain-containing protein [Bradyrhizobium sp. WD16]UTD28544.1 hypothetical protein DB459_18190 [Bradyrhizobium sp. WD16]